MISYKYKLYRTDKSMLLQETLAEACHVWNHALALQKRYYRLYKRFISANAMQKHFTKVWHRHYLGSQSLQEILQRQDTAYKRFFKRISKRPPKFKKVSDFTSFLYKQCGQVHDHDLLAARNILRKGIYELESNRKTDAALQQGSCA